MVFLSRRTSVIFPFVQPCSIQFLNCYLKLIIMFENVIVRVEQTSKFDNYGKIDVSNVRISNEKSIKLKRFTITVI